MEAKIKFIKDWLGTGCINIFGLPMSGKDTIGLRLAEALDVKFMSSGMIIRAMEKAKGESYTDKGDLAPSAVFFELVLPYFGREDLKEFGFILSSVGRWQGEESLVIETAQNSGHPIKAAVVLNISEADVKNRWETAKILGDRGGRPDDEKPKVFEKRLQEFKNKTLPVITHYQRLGLLVPVRADMDRDVVYREIVDRLYEFAVKDSSQN